MPIDFTSGVPHTTGIPDHDPGDTGGRVAFDYVSEKLYKWVSGTSWIEIPTAGGNATVDYPAGENLSSGRVVIIEGGEAIYFQVSNVLHAGRAYGITTTSALTGETVNLQLIGEASDVAFSFAADSVLWVGADGEIFDTFQAGPAVQKAGVSSGTTKFKIDFAVQIIAI